MMNDTKVKAAFKEWARKKGYKGRIIKITVGDTRLLEMRLIMKYTVGQYYINTYKILKNGEFRRLKSKKMTFPQVWTKIGIWREYRKQMKKVL
jgi:hypothetical protein